MDFLVTIIIAGLGLYFSYKKEKKKGNDSKFVQTVDKIKDELIEDIKMIEDEDSFFMSDEKIFGEKASRQSTATTINERARQNIAKQDLEQTKTRIAEEEHELTMDEIIRRKEEELRFGNPSEHQEIPEEQHLMEIVEDLIVKGPNTDIPNTMDLTWWPQS